MTTQDVFAEKRIVFFALPGAFTPACSDSHLPAYERLYDEFRSLGIDQVVCLSVNDAFVMFQWAKSRARLAEEDDGLMGDMRRPGDAASPSPINRLAALSAHCFR